MVLYVDETENDRFFIVCGIIVDSQQSVDIQYKHFKKKVSNYDLSQKTKTRIFKEFKSAELDHRFQKIKSDILKNAVATKGAVIFSTYVKKNAHFNQTLKEATYITLLSGIVNAVDDSVDIVFDSVNRPIFEKNIIEAISPFDNVSSIVSGDSECYAGLQFIDNICGAIRLYISGEDAYGYYEIIKNILTEV